MRLKRSRDVTRDDLPRIESPLIARSQIEDALAGINSEPISGIEEILHADFPDISPCSQARLRLDTLLDKVDSGQLLLIHDQQSNPFRPVFSCRPAAPAPHSWILNEPQPPAARGTLQSLLKLAH